MSTLDRDVPDLGSNVNKGTGTMGVQMPNEWQEVCGEENLLKPFSSLVLNKYWIKLSGLGINTKVSQIEFEMSLLSLHFLCLVFCVHA
jgi:hypothetical protein